MVEQTPEQRADALRRRVADLERRIADLTGKILFADELSALSRRESRLTELDTSLGRLRERGYLWGADLEPSLRQLAAAAPPCLAQARSETTAVGDRLRPGLDEAGRSARAVAASRQITAEEHRVDVLQRQVEGLEKVLAEARERLSTLTASFVKGFDQLERRLREATTTLDRFAQSSFALLPEEHPVAAVAAVWQDPPDKEKKKGFLLLSDHRLRFEQREEVVTKRKLLIFAAEKELIAKGWVDEPIGHLAASTDSTKGMVFKDQLVALSWKAPCRWVPTTTFEIEEGTAVEADRLIEAVLSGDLVKDRYVVAAAAAGGAVAAPAAPTRLEWPEKCTDCGARVAPPVKGQTRVDCQYCGRSFPVREVAG